MDLTSSRLQIKKYIDNQSSLDTLRFITCGSVDDGKSTLIGCMLYESKQIFEDQVSLLKNESKKYGTQGNNLDFALLMDGLVAEREQGITIDVAYRYFSTDKRKFIVADTPGHEQYTRNMVTGASNADVGIILIDACKGILPQTRRHSIICSTLGIKKILVTINKMDLVNYSNLIFQKLESEYLNFANKLNFESITIMPISALKGDNIVNRYKTLNWYKGPTLMGFLETVDLKKSIKKPGFRFPVQWVNRPNMNFRGFSGTVTSGSIKKGQEIQILPSGIKAIIKDIILYKHSLSECEEGRAVTILLDREVDVSRGDIIVKEDADTKIADQFESEIVWMNADHGYVGRSYLMKIGTSLINAQIIEIKHKTNVNTYEKMPAKKLELNDLSTVNIKTEKLIAYDKYKDNTNTGAFILIDRISNQTVAAGMISFALRRSQNLYRQKLDVNKEDRQILNGHTSKVIWFTGLSGSGKSTIANSLEKELYKKGYRTYVLDGDNIRYGLNKDLGFTNADRVENIRRVSEVAKLMVDAGIIVITAFISPFEAERKMARDMFGDGEFIEVFVDTPINIIEKRDPKGLYAKARKGELPNFTGIDSPYEKPKNPEIHVSSEKDKVHKIVDKILSYINVEVNN